MRRIGSIIGPKLKLTSVGGDVIDLRDTDVNRPANAWAVVRTSIDYSVTRDKRIILVDAHAGNVNVYLPDVADQPLPLTIKKTDTSTYTVTAITKSGQYLDTDETSIALGSPNEALVLMSDGLKWHIIVEGGRIWWDDLRVPMTATNLGGTKDPGFAKIRDNGSGSQGVFAYLFDKSTEEELHFMCQLPHAWKYGGQIEAHVHWSPVANGTSGHVVSWGLEYTWASVAGDFGNTTIVYTNTHYPADAVLVADRHYLSSFGELADTGKGISSMLVCRIFRDATGGGLTDSYTDDAALLEVDFHYRIEQPGSRAMTTY
jgi:hypothetical protein